MSMKTPQPATSYETARQVLLTALAMHPGDAIPYTNEVLRLAEPADDALLSDYKTFRKAVHAVVIKCRGEVHKLGVLFDDWDLREPGAARLGQTEMFPDHAPRREDFEL